MNPEFNISLERSGASPLYLQIATAIQRAIESGALAPGIKLSSTREIATRLNVQRKTVVQAFRHLGEGGWVTAGVGQGTFVRRPTGPSAEAIQRAADAGDSSVGSAFASGTRFEWDSLARSSETADDRWTTWLRERAPADCIQFTGATADPASFPAEEFRAALDEVLQTNGGRALDYGPAAGYAPLREWIAERLREKGVDADVEQVLIVNGSQQGLDLVARLLLRAGDRVLVEEPSYSNGFRLLQTHGAAVEGVRFDEGGIDLAALEQACRRGGARMLYTMPLFQNPTGLELAPARVEPLLEICRRHRVPIVEDLFDAELFYEGEAPHPIKAGDAFEQVILIGTFSKILFPGLRLGWILAPRALVGALRELKQMTDLSTGLLAQQAMELYCRRGLLDAHLDRVRQLNGARLRALLSALEAEMPEGTSWTRPRGGMTVWLRLPDGVSSWDLLRIARRRGVDFSPGPLFFPNGGGAQHLRLCFVREPEERIRQGVEILGKLIEGHRAEPAEMAIPRPFV